MDYNNLFMNQDLSSAEKVSAFVLRVHSAFNELLARTEAAEVAQETLQKAMAEYKDRVEKAEAERDEYFNHIKGFCFCCGHREDGFDCHAKCYGHKRGSAWVYAGPRKDE